MPDGVASAGAGTMRPAPGADGVEHFDVLIVGAGLSGINAACRFELDRGTWSYAILEGRDRSGGTWDLFRYPGIRSDSDMHTLGFRFRPWRDLRPLAPGGDILSYLRETAREFGVDRKIRLGHRVEKASWSSRDARWTLEVSVAGGTAVSMTCGFLLMASGYYDYSEGYSPEFPGAGSFEGQLIHPQFWPDHLDYAGKKVVVIGSGATAVTLVPAMAPQAGHVTMLQRSPSYVVSLPVNDWIGDRLRALLPERAALRAIRGRNILLTRFLYRLARQKPEKTKQRIIAMAREQLPDGFDVEKHFSPSYKPWDQRMCLVPDGDLFTAIREQKASVETDVIETFIPKGLRLKSGKELEADIVISATGLKMNVLGDVAIDVDGVAVKPSEQMSYKGMMLSGLPNAALIVGYTNASWTLKADLVCGYVVRLLTFMRRRGYAQVVPVRDANTTETPFLDFSSGYVLRAADLLPKQGDKAPWRLHQDYLRDLVMLRFGRLTDRALRFSRR